MSEGTSVAFAPIKIVRYNSEGEGIGFIDKKVSFAPYCAVGDFILPLQVKSFPRFNRILSYKLLSPSSQRVDAPCPHFTQCGGCDFQHLPYEEELRIKEDIVKNAFLKIAQIKKIPLLPIQPSPNEWNYRNRAQIHLEKGEAGFYAAKSHQLINIETCLLLEKVIETIPKEIQTDNAFKDATILSLIATQKGYCIQKDRNISEVNQFSQINQPVNQLIQKRITERIQKRADSTYLLDLFCGNGNLSFPLAPYYKKIVGIDYSQNNIDQANEQAKREGLFHCHYIKGDCFKKINSFKIPFDTILIDPPRRGAKGIAKQIASLPVKSLFYLSCNPTTLARDIAALLEVGFQLHTVEPFDMFPKTHHVEVLVLLQKE